jgi:hypothetical protein
MSPMQARCSGRASLPFLYAYSPAIPCHRQGMDVSPGPVRFIATLSPATAPPSRLGPFSSDDAVPFVLRREWAFDRQCTTIGRRSVLVP